MQAYLLTSCPAHDEMRRHCNWLNSPAYNRIMFEHYEALYKSYRRTWRWMKTYFVWKRMLYYKEQLQRAQVQHLLNDLNKVGYVTITTNS